MTEAARLEVVAHGRVQGVGFRVFVVARARSLGVSGWVANEPGGRVRCVAEGERSSLERLLGSIRTGPPGAAVERAEATWTAATGAFERFEVRSGAHPGD